MIEGLLLFAALVSLAVAALCAGAETGFLSVRRGRVLHMAREGGRRAKIVFEAISNLGRTTTALLVGNNLASVSYSSATAALAAELADGSPVAGAFVSAGSALALLFLGEFLPKLLCAARPLRRILGLAPYWRWLSVGLAPVGSVVQVAVERLLPRREAKARVTPETVLRILADRKDGVRLSELERALIARILQLRERGEFVVPESVLSAVDECVS